MYRTEAAFLILTCICLASACGATSAIRGYEGPERSVSEVARVRSLPLCDQGQSSDSGECSQGTESPKSTSLRVVMVFAVDGKKLSQDGPINGMKGSFELEVLPGKRKLTVAHGIAQRGGIEGAGNTEILAQVEEPFDEEFTFEAGKTYEFDVWTGPASILPDGRPQRDGPLSQIRLREVRSR